MRKLGTGKTARLAVPLPEEQLAAAREHYGRGGVAKRARDMLAADMEGRIIIKPPTKGKPK